MIVARFDTTFNRFLLNGLFATAVHYAVLAALIELANFKSAGLANGLAAPVGIAVSYMGNKLLVFKSMAAHTRTLPGFLLVYFLVAAQHAGVLVVWTDYAKLPYTLGFMIATAASFLLNYFGNRLFVFTAANSRQRTPRRPNK